MVIAETEAAPVHEPKRGRSQSKRDLEGVSTERGISAQKKLKIGVDRSKGRAREEKDAARVGTMQISNRCLLLERESYKEGSLQEVSVEKQDRGEFMQTTPDGEKKVGRSKKNGVFIPMWWRLALLSRKIAMIHLFWNCRGLGSNTVVRALHGQIREHIPSMIFLSETKMKDHRIAGVRRRLGYSNGFDVAPIERAGGLSLWWEDSVQVEVLNFSKHFIDAKCGLVDSHVRFRFTGIYATSYRMEKEEFWRGMIQDFSPDNIPWICGGDFNEVLWDHERFRGAEVRYNRPRYLEEFMSKVEVMDLGFNGPKFTWRGTRNGQLVEARLDRGLVNACWQSTWPNTSVKIGTSLGSDHSPVVVICEPKSKKSKKMFRFEAFWAKEGECRDIVRSAWSHSREGSPAERQEESYWQQRSRVQWLNDGDANTKFFHQSTLQRRRRNNVVTLKNNNGEWIDSPNLIRSLIDDHFMELFKSSGHRDWGGILDYVLPKVTNEMNATLTGMVSVDEVKYAALQMGGIKAPGPDGFPGIFYQAHWDILAADVNEIIGNLMHGLENPMRINATHLVLIPKVQNSESVSQFRPISLCNYSYKILSKILANRLKPLLPEIISPTQNAFVVGRQIQDNIGIAHELFHFLKMRKAKCKFELGIKLDMHKAYDRVEWDFLMVVMEKLGFDSKWRSLILGCISSVNFAIILNGLPGTKFAPSRGLRQGDPLFPLPILIASGQKVNKSKSSVFFGKNIPESLSVQLANILGMERVGDPCVYLEVPAIWGRSKKSRLAYVKERLLGKLRGWKKTALSQAGREVLIKAVAQAIPAYPMNLFKFPNSLCNELDAMISKFWWGQKGGEQRIHWVSREKLGWAKDMGGLGLRSFEVFNDALLAKQCWRLIEEPNSLWGLVLKARSEFEAILGIHIGDPLLRDRLVWPLDKKRVYSVKSGYKWMVGRNMPPGDTNISSSTTIPAHLWKCVWKLEASPNIRCFIWKTLQEAVATMANLFQMRSAPSPLCPICMKQDETIVYLFLLCPWVEAVWFGGSLGMRINQTDTSSWASWLLQRFDSTRGASEVILAISLSVTSFKNARGGPRITPHPRGQVQLVDACWSRPCQGFVKINVDASWGSCDERGFTGIVAWDEAGRFLAASRSGVLATSVAMGEALAILHGCMLGKRMGWRRISIESDSLESISCLRDMVKKGSWDAFPVLLKCVRLGKDFLDCRWSWVPRPANSVADLLASRSSREVCDHVWVDRPPSSLIHVLCNDGLPCPP
ncbi:unnamed protein product [Malus baccata var. baccata]